MEPLSQRALSALIGSIYESALDPCLWTRTLGEIAQAFGAARALLSLNDLRRDHVLIGCSFGWDPHWLRIRSRHAPEIHARLSEFFARQPGPNEPFIASRELRPEHVLASGYVRECLGPLGIGDVAHYFLIRTSAYFSELALMQAAQHGPIDGRQTELISLLLPHLRRAMHLSMATGAPTGIETLGAAFGLTFAELRIATALLAGHKLNGIADELGVSRTTVKTHLAAIFRKTGVNRQADLVRLAMSRTTLSAPGA